MTTADMQLIHRPKLVLNIYMLTLNNGMSANTAALHIAEVTDNCLIAAVNCDFSAFGHVMLHRTKCPA